MHLKYRNIPTSLIRGHQVDFASSLAQRFPACKRGLSVRDAEPCQCTRADLNTSDSARLPLPDGAQRIGNGVSGLTARDLGLAA